MAAQALWSHEVRRCGRATLILPIVIAVLSATVAAAAGPSMRGFLLRWLPGAAIPLAAGLASAAIVGRERAVELQSTVPTPYPATMRRRLLVLAVSVVVAVTLGAAAGFLAGPGGRPDSTTALALAVLLAGAGARVAVRAGSGAASVLVLTVWLAVLALSDRLPGPPWVPDAAWAAAGLVLVRLTFRVADGEIR